MDTPRLKSFFSYLLIHRNSPLSRQRLSYLFWPNSSESQARTNLRNLLYHLREDLPDADLFLDVGSKTLSWHPDAPFKIDLDDFEDALVRAEDAQKAGDQAAHREALEEAVDSYGGDLLPSCYDDWIFPDRERLSQAYMRALEQLVEILEADRDYDAAIKKAQQLLRHDHLHEVTYCRLMRLHALNGDTARALRTYHTCVDTLEKELGLDPGVATRDLYKQLLDRDFEVEAPPRVAEKGTALIGRDEAWGTLQMAWRDLDRQPHLTLIKGEAGIGKTYLAEEFLRWARREGITGIKTRSYPAEGELAYTPVTELLKSEPISSKFVSLEDTWLTEIARLLPELRIDRPDLPDPEQLSENWQRQRMFEACAIALLQGEGVLVVVFDDLQWCDRETLAWLRYMMDYDSKTNLMFVATLRTEEITADSPLTSFFSDLQRSGMITEIGLGRLDQGATLSLASNLSGHHLDDQAAERLFQETEGNPLFVVEAVRSGFLGEEDSALGTTKLPPKVQAVIETRLGALSPGSREIASIAAVVGREFGFDLLFRAVEKSEESVVQGLDELWQRRVIREEGVEGYAFSHDKFREVIYQGLSPPRRIYFHRKVADALEEINLDQVGKVAPQLAHHFDRAGEQDKAIKYFIKAGDQALRVYARQDAMDYYQRASVLLGDRKDVRSISLYQGWGNALLGEARYEEAADAYREMRSSAGTAQDGKAEAQAWLALSNAKDRLGDHHGALESAERATKVAQDTNAIEEKVAAVLMKGQMHYRLGDMVKALNLGKEALVLSEDLEDKHTIARCLNFLGLVHDVLGDYGQARKHKEDALSLFKEIDNHQAKWWIGNIYCNIANTANLRGEFLQAVDLYLKALEIMQEISDQDLEIMCLVNLGAARVGMGAYELAERDLSRVLELTESSGWLGLSLTYHFLAEAFLGQVRLEDALAAAIKALDYAQETGAQESLGAAWRSLGKVASQRPEGVTIEGQAYQAEACFINSEKIFVNVGADAERAHTLRAWGTHELDLGNEDRGGKLWAEAKEIFQRLDVPAEVERMEKN